MVDVPAVAVELIELLAVVVGAGAASAIGVVLERFGLTAVTAGDLALGAWAVGMGLLALYVGGRCARLRAGAPRIQRIAAGE